MTKVSSSKGNSPERKPIAERLLCTGISSLPCEQWQIADIRVDGEQNATGLVPLMP